MKRRSFLKMVPAAGFAAWMPRRALSAASPTGNPSETLGLIESPKLTIMGAGTAGLQVIKALQADGVERGECLYGSTVKPDAELGSRLLVFFGETDVFTWEPRARRIQRGDVLVGACALGKSEDRFAVPALEELAYLANQAGVHSTVAVVSLPFDDERRGSRRLWALDQLRDIRKAFAMVIPVDANRLLQRRSSDAAMENDRRIRENDSRILDRHMTACVAAIRRSTIAAAIKHQLSNRLHDVCAGPRQ